MVTAEQTQGSGEPPHTHAGVGSQSLHGRHGMHDDALGELRPGRRLSIHSDDVPQARDQRNDVLEKHKDSLHFSLNMSERVCMLSRVRLCNPMDYSPPGSSVHGIIPARILEWVVISYSRASSQFRNPTHPSCIGRWRLYHYATWKAYSSLFCINELGK